MTSYMRSFTCCRPSLIHLGLCNVFMFCLIFAHRTQIAPLVTTSSRPPAPRCRAQVSQPSSSSDSNPWASLDHLFPSAHRSISLPDFHPKCHFPTINFKPPSRLFQPVLERVVLCLHHFTPFPFRMKSHTILIKAFINKPDISITLVMHN